MPQLSLHSPIGDLTVSEEEATLVSVDWGSVELQSYTQLLLRARAQLQDYFDGKRQHFDLPLAPVGTLYQRRVWNALMRIPYGETRTYAQIAVIAGGSPRSVGGANGRNPLPIIIPCHRVLNSTGLGGYSGAGGVDTKRWLLSREAKSAIWSVA